MAVTADGSVSATCCGFWEQSKLAKGYFKPCKASSSLKRTVRGIHLWDIWLCLLFCQASGWEDQVIFRLTPRNSVS